MSRVLTRRLDRDDYEIVRGVTMSVLVAWIVVFIPVILASSGPLHRATYLIMVAVLGLGFGLAGFYMFVFDHLRPETASNVRVGLVACSMATGAAGALYLGWSTETFRIFTAFGFWASMYLAGVDLSTKFDARL